MLGTALVDFKRRIYNEFVKVKHSSNLIKHKVGINKQTNK